MRDQRMIEEERLRGIGRSVMKHGISLERWENDAMWQVACMEASQEDPWKCLYRDLLFLRVREAGAALKYYGIWPKSEKAIAHVRGMIALLSDREREVMVQDGDYRALVDILYEDDSGREYKIGLCEEQAREMPEFVKENMKRFASDGMRAFPKSGVA